jgi:hypothetical protein
MNSLKGRPHKLDLDSKRPESARNCGAPLLCINEYLHRIDDA